MGYSCILPWTENEYNSSKKPSTTKWRSVLEYDEEIILWRKRPMIQLSIKYLL